MTGETRVVAVAAIVTLFACQDSEKVVIDRQAMAASVRVEFLHAWQGYEEHAWGHDALRTSSLSYRDWYDHSLYMTPIDAFDTMLLMGLEQEAAAAKTLIVSDSYAYLLFAPDDTIDFDAVIFNTEAHPIWRTWE